MAAFLSPIWRACGAEDNTTMPDDVQVIGHASLPSVFAVSELAADAVACAGAAAAAFIQARFDVRPQVQVDRRLASFWFASTISPQGWKLDPDRDAVTGDYATQDGWIRLHANAHHHRAAALNVLGVTLEASQQDPALVAAAIAKWSAEALEQAIVDEGGCAARMRSLNEWAAHPQGIALQGQPLIEHPQLAARQPRSGHLPSPAQGSPAGSCGPASPGGHTAKSNAARALAEHATRARPLQGIKVLDLTRVLAGPVCTRFLAGLGADVLRIDPSWWQEAGLEPETTVGKHCATLDLRSEAGLARLRELISQADVLVHGWRPGAMPGLGLDDAARRALNPDLVDVSLDAYGWAGPWQGRRGFDSLVQMSTGIAHEGMVRRGTTRPTPLPVQALDHATGYMLACAALRGLARRLTHGVATTAKASLVQTAHMLIAGPRPKDEDLLAPLADADYADRIEHTSWGPARRLAPPLLIEGAPLIWNSGARRFRSDPPDWADGGH